VSDVEKLHLEIITPDRVMVSEDVDMLEARGALGDFGVLPGHTTFLTTIVPCEVRFMTEGKTRQLSAGGGFAEVNDNGVTMLLDAAEFPEEVDLERAKRALQRAETALKELSSEDKEYRVFEAALLRAIARISTAEKNIG
jgi:F-type H+-transporting ATPase subunit epsilon